MSYSFMRTNYKRDNKKIRANLKIANIFKRNYAQHALKSTNTLSLRNVFRKLYPMAFNTAMYKSRK